MSLSITARVSPLVRTAVTTAPRRGMGGFYKPPQRSMAPGHPSYYPALSIPQLGGAAGGLGWGGNINSLKTAAKAWPVYLALAVGGGVGLAYGGFLNPDKKLADSTCSKTGRESLAATG